MGASLNLAAQSPVDIVGQAQAQVNLAAAAAAAAAAGIQGGAAPNTIPQGVPVTGRVKAWYDDKGWGFLTPDNGGPDVFVHRNQLSAGQSLEQGASVSFEARLNPMRGKYEATRCEGAMQPQAAAMEEVSCGAKGAAKGQGGPILTDPSDNMFVAGLPLDMDEEAIRAIFNQFGVVKQCKVLNANPGKPDVAALVRMTDLNQAKWLVENLNGNIPQGMSVPITVRFADNRAEKARALEGFGYGKASGKGFGAGGGNRFSPYEGAAAQDALGYYPFDGATAPDASGFDLYGGAAASDASSLSSAALATALSQLGQTSPGLMAEGTANPLAGALAQFAGAQAQAQAQATDPLSSLFAQLSPGLLPPQPEQPPPAPAPQDATLQALQSIQSLAGLLGVGGAGAAGGGAPAPGLGGLAGLGLEGLGSSLLQNPSIDLLNLLSGVGQTQPGLTMAEAPAQPWQI
mmetsp:Transcript_121237/g.343484  ORF Transcript_121237/g.343484 Transcript_121237/m.343484 type:complete len:459 (-) Transcript_121237:508-1884(-)